jgi:hypothetical protein
LLTASGYVPGGSGTTIYNAIQYTTNKKQKKTQETQNNTYTLKTIHNAIITNTITQKQCTKGNRSIKQYDKRNIHMYNYRNMI